MTSSSDPADRDVRAELRQAYEQGRRDARRARRRHPVAMTLTFLAAAVGVVVLALALANGSFSGAGDVVDRSLAAAADQAGRAARDAVPVDKAAPADRPS